MNFISKQYHLAKLVYRYYRGLLHNKKEFDWLVNDWPRLYKMHNKHKDEDCFIICNGPSLNNTNLELLNDYYTIGLNKIFLIFKKLQLNLDYLVAVNTLVIEQSIEEYAKMDIPVFLSMHKNFGIESANLHYIKTNGNFTFSRSFYDQLSEGYTVTYVALQIAYIMGFKRVFIVGADHYFKQEGKPNAEQTMQGDDINHFDPNYFKGQKWHLADIEGNEISYRIADKKYKEYGRKIYNSTVGGHLEIFERLPFEEALKIAKKKNAK